MSRHLLVEADGGSRGNPGPAGYGSVVRDADTGEVLAEVSASLGHTTNNVAEYSGLIAGLQAAARIAPGADTEVRMDSKLVVEQMSGRWQIKHPGLRPLAAQARRAAGRLGRVRYTWVPRARNAHADRLANEAMDAAARAEGTGTGARGTRGAGGRRRASRAAGTSGDDAAGPGNGAAGREDWPTATPGQRNGTDGTAGQGSGATGTAGRRSGTDGAGSPGTRARPAARWPYAQGTPATVLLLRHGETPWSPERRFAGTSDIPLTETGVRQAAAAAARLAAWPGRRGGGGIAAIVASPLRRTRQTAVAVSQATGLPVTTDPAWAEVDFGEWEGLTHAEAGQRWPAEISAWQADSTAVPPGGESMASATRRVLRGLEALLAAHPGECVLVVSHVTPIKIVLRHALLAPPATVRHMFLDVASLCETDWYPDGTGIMRSFNDTAHLAAHGAFPAHVRGA